MKFISNSRILLYVIVVAITALVIIPVSAQEEISGPIYVVEAGDTLSSIALRFGVTVEDLVQTNSLENANALAIGDRLVIPGLEGISGRLETTFVNAGENLRSLTRSYQIPKEIFLKLNRLVSPAELHRGAALVITRGGEISDPFRVQLIKGESLLETAVRAGENPWRVTSWNGMSNPIRSIPGDILVVSQSGDSGALGLPIAVKNLEITSLFQGEPATLLITTDGEYSVSGELGPYNLAFIQNTNGFLALQGIHALLEGGMYPLKLEFLDSQGNIFEYMQYLRIQPREYIFEYITVDPELIDPETTAAEFEMIQPYLQVISPEKLWSGLFELPSPFEDCLNSTFGNRRSYNGSAFTYYHAGLDFCGGTGVNIFAPAAGTVVYTAPLEVRGNFTLIDHGWGIFSAYLHQSEIFVSVGERVEAGDIIGLVGNTGRSTGPHLHWEVLVNGVPVNPLIWLEREIP